MKNVLIFLFLTLTFTVYSQNVITVPSGYKGHVNVFFVETANGWILIDVAGESDFENIKAVMKENDIEPGNVHNIILTHGHSDHVGGLNLLREYTGAKVISHESIKEGIEKGVASDATPRTIFASILNLFFGSLEITPAKVDITFKDEIDLTVYGIDAKAIHSPGHSKGSITIMFNNGVTFIGDQLRDGKKGLNIGMIYDDEELAIRSIKVFKKSNLTDIYLSHGTKITKDQIIY